MAAGGDHVGGQIVQSLWLCAIGKNIAGKGIAQRLIAFSQRPVIGGDAAIKHFGHLAHLLAHRHIAYPHFAQRVVHVAKQFVDKVLAEYVLPALQAVENQEGMEADHVEAAVNAVGHAPFGIGAGMPCGGHNCHIDGTSPVGSILKEAFQEHRLAAMLAPGVKESLALVITVWSRRSAMSHLSRLSAPMWLCAAICATLLAGCSPTIDHRGYVAKPGAFGQITNGMGKTEVEGILGSPSTRASINFNGDSSYYITSITEGRAFLTPKETSREVIAIRFDRQDQVQSFAQYGLQDGRIIDVNTRRSPVAGEDLSILRNIFRGLLNSNAGPGGPVLGRKL